jgi:hypothetical protein
MTVVTDMAETTVIVFPRCAATNGNGDRRCPFPASPGGKACPVHAHGQTWQGMRV